MGADRLAVHLALRARLLTLAVVTTGSTTLEATATGYARAAGSFLDDGFEPGMEVTPSGFASTTPGTVTAVAALTLTIDGGRTAEAAGAGRTLAVGLPSRMAWENVPLAPVVGQPFGEEEFVPTPGRARTFPADVASMEETGLYVVRVYVPQQVGTNALRRYADALVALFKAGTGLTPATGHTLRVRSDFAPWASGVRFQTDATGRAVAAGWAVVTVTIPWRLEYLNT